MIARLPRWGDALALLGIFAVALVLAGFRWQARRCFSSTAPVLQGAGHIPQIEDPARFNELLVAFLGKLAP